MAKAMIGIGTAFVAAVAGVAGSALLYFVVVGLAALVTGGSEAPEAPGLARRTMEFGTTFGLLSGAHWGLASARRLVGEERSAMLAVRLVTLALAALGILLVFTGGRWTSMFGGLAGPGVVLAIAWMALTHLVSKVVEKRTPAGNPAGAA